MRSPGFVFFFLFFCTAPTDETGQVNEYAEPWLTSVYWAVTTMSTIGTPPRGLYCCCCYYDHHCYLHRYYHRQYYYYECFYYRNTTTTSYTATAATAIITTAIFTTYCYLESCSAFFAPETGTHSQTSHPTPNG